MSRPTLTLTRATPRTKPSLSLVKKAIKLFKGRGVPREVYRRNALAWIAVRLRMGDKHVLKGYGVRWGQPGEPQVDQIFAPRRLKGTV